jgi:hypothetical protein
MLQSQSVLHVNPPDRLGHQRNGAETACGWLKPICKVRSGASPARRQWEPSHVCRASHPRSAACSGASRSGHTPVCLAHLIVRLPPNDQEVVVGMVEAAARSLDDLDGNLPAGPGTVPLDKDAGRWLRAVDCDRIAEQWPWG